MPKSESLALIGRGRKVNMEADIFDYTRRSSIVVLHTFSHGARASASRVVVRAVAAGGIGGSSSAHSRVGVIANAGSGGSIATDAIVKTRGARIEGVDAVKGLIEFYVEDGKIPFNLKYSRGRALNKGL